MSENYQRDESKPYASAAVPPSAEACGVQWEVHKFGGASLATAELYKECSDLLIDQSRRLLGETGACMPTMAVMTANSNRHPWLLLSCAAADRAVRALQYRLSRPKAA